MKYINFNYNYIKNRNLFIIFLIIFAFVFFRIYYDNKTRILDYYNNNNNNNNDYSGNYNNNDNDHSGSRNNNNNGNDHNGSNNDHSGSNNNNENFSQKKEIRDNIVYDYPSIYGDPYRYPNVVLPDHVIGCGRRREPCLGGSQIPIPNTLPPINISNQNIAPMNLTVRGFDEGVQQVGTIQKVFGADNIVYPLFGRKRFRNDNKWDYFVKFGKYGVVLPLVPLRNYEELNTNDRTFIDGQKGEYRVTMYDPDIPQYLPFT